MNLTIEEIIKIWREEKQKEEELLKSAPREHPQKTPDCLSFFRFKDFVEGAIELTPEENLHIQNCSYCPKVLAAGRKRIVEIFPQVHRRDLHALGPQAHRRGFDV